MSSILHISDIQSITLHWAESDCINQALDGLGLQPSDQSISAEKLDELIRSAASACVSGFEKLELSIVLKNGLQWCANARMYITHRDTGLLSVINKGE